MIERKRGRLKPDEIKFLRRNVVGVSQNQFGRWLHVRSRSAISNWENGHHEMPWPAEMILRLVAAESAGRPFKKVTDPAWLMRNRSSLDG